MAVAAHQNFDPLPREARRRPGWSSKSPPASLTLVRNGNALKTYRVALGRAPAGAKQYEGDQRTPEGIYTIDFHKLDSDYHLALHVSYPEQRDVDRAAAQGLSAGGDIMIHGFRMAAAGSEDFTGAATGRRAVSRSTDFEIEEIYRAVPDGTPIEIRP